MFNKTVKKVIHQILGDRKKGEFLDLAMKIFFNAFAISDNL